MEGIEPIVVVVVVHRRKVRARAGAVKEGLKARGVLISTDGPNDDVLKIKPPLVISADDCDFFLDALCAVL